MLWLVPRRSTKFCQQNESSEAVQRHAAVRGQALLAYISLLSCFFAIQTPLCICCSWSLCRTVSLISSTTILIHVSSSGRVECLAVSLTLLPRGTRTVAGPSDHFPVFSPVLLLQVPLCSPQPEHPRQLRFQPGLPLRSRCPARAAVTEGSHPNWAAQLHPRT